MNPYERLQLKPGASERQVSKAFRRLALRHHPDKFTDATDKKHAEAVFKQLVDARDAILSGSYVHRAPDPRTQKTRPSAPPGAPRAGKPPHRPARKSATLRFGPYVFVLVAYVVVTATGELMRAPIAPADPVDVKLHTACHIGVMDAERLLAPKTLGEEVERQGQVVCESVLRDFKSRPGGLTAIHGDPVELFCAIGIDSTFEKYGFGRETHTTLSDRAQLALEHCTAELAIQARR